MRMTKKDYLASGFKDVDRAEDLSTYSSCLTLLNSLEFFREYKQASFSLLELRQGMSVLDAGSGLGEDALKIASAVSPGGRVTGVDLSAHMVKEACSKLSSDTDNIEFLVGDVTKLEFPDESFDRCRIDRTLQHLDRPEEALSELCRVLKPGGIMLAFDNDWETFTISSSMHAAVRKVCNYWCSSFPSGWIGRELYGIFRGLGLDRVEVHPRTLVITDLETSDRVFDIFNSISRAQELGIISDEEAKGLRHEIGARDVSGTFFSSYTGFMVLGRKPG